MALSANLFLRQNQSLVMTPQLMQSIQLLQMTHVELVQFIAQEVEKNPLLEFPSDDAETGSDYDPQDEAHSRQADDDRADALSGDWYDNGTEGNGSRLKEELDANYANVFQDDGAPARVDAPELISQWKSMPGSGDGENYDLDDFVAGQVSLKDYLAQQVPFILPDMADRLIAQQMIELRDRRLQPFGDCDAKKSCAHQTARELMRSDASFCCT